MKKNKKQKEVIPEFVLGRKIRDIKLSEKQHFLFFCSMLVLFNLILVMSAWFVLYFLKAWYYWVVCVVIVCVCCGLSFKTFNETKRFNTCEIYNNAINLQTIWVNLKIELKDIYEMQVKETFWDRIFKLNTKSLEVKIMGQKRKRFIVHFVEEDAVKLKHEITMLIDRYVQTLELNKIDEKSAID